MVLPWLSILLSLLALTVSVQGQPVFLSIDCGIAEELNYTDKNTQIFYTSDAKFIETGTNKDISKDYMITERLPRQYQNLRFFPDGNRSCYTLTPVTKSNRYLLRASFMYGNYDGLNKTPQFDVYVGVNRWDVVLPSTAGERVRNEIITYATMDYVSVCLVNTGKGTPFISALELRILNNLSYEAANESQYLRLLYRNQFRPIDSGRPIRYPDDAYDRIWSLWEVNGWKPINTSFAVDLVSSDKIDYRLPLPVMNTAVVPSDPNGNLSFYFPTSNGDPKLQYHVYMHFAELQQLNRNQSREFNIIVNGNLFYGPFSPTFRSQSTIYSDSPLSGRYQHEFVISKTTSSTLPPIFNAEEIFVLEPLSATPTDSKDVEAMLDIKSAYQVKGKWMGDPCVPKYYSWDGLTCDYPLEDAPTILSMNLSSTGLNGEIAASIANLMSIRSLDLSRNNLTGAVPNFLGDLPSLSLLNLSGNQLNGLVPSNLLEKSKKGSLKLSIDSNPNLIGSVNDINKVRKITVPVLASVISTLVLLTIAGFVHRRFTQRRRQRASIVKTKSGSMLYENRRFPYAQVVSMTNNFEKSIGKGGFGTVYKGQMTTGTQVAVKMLFPRSTKAPCQGSNEFENEVQLLMRVHHKNLVSFIGYCQEEGNMALVYEYMAHGNLGSHLSVTDDYSNALSWDRRLCIALDVAQGLEYLHDDCKPAIIHRDVKTANILLNERLEAKIGDFGLSRVFNDEFTHVSTTVKGTFGYLDPEYCNSNNLTEKSDVYSFGVVLLQLITGKPAIVRITNSERISLIDWVIPMVVGGDIRDVIDPKFEGNYDIKSIQKVAKIARACTSPKSIDRPHMRDVVVELKEYIGNEKALESKSAPKNSGCIDSGPVQTTSEILSYLSAR